MWRIPAVLALVLLPSCLEVEATVTLAADGSGKQTIRMAIGEDLLATVKQAAPAAAPGGGDPLLLFQEEQARKELESAGLSVERYATDKTRGRRNLSIQVAFAGVAGLRKSPLAGGAADWFFCKGPAKDTVRIEFYPRGRQAWLEAMERLRKLPELDQEMLRSFFEKQKRQLQGLDLRFTLDLPTDVVSCSGRWSKTGPRQLTATFQAKDIRTMEDLVTALAPRCETVVAADGITIPLEAAPDSAPTAEAAPRR